MSELAIIQELTGPQIAKLKNEITKILSLDLDVTGELVEISLLSVYPNSSRQTLNSKDKRWIDLVMPTKGIEVKTFQVAKSLKKITADTSVKNVLKRISKVDHLNEKGEYRNANEIGKDLINYLHQTITEHAIQKNVSGELTMGILFRTVQNTSFAYWEQKLNFGEYTDYEWSWNHNASTKTDSIIGVKDGETVFSWYCNNQKQFFYLYKVPENAIFFEIDKAETNKEAFIITREELDAQIQEAFQKGVESVMNR